MVDAFRFSAGGGRGISLGIGKIEVYMEADKIIKYTSGGRFRGLLL